MFCRKVREVNFREKKDHNTEKRRRDESIDESSSQTPHDEVPLQSTTKLEQSSSTENSGSGFAMTVAERVATGHIRRATSTPSPSMAPIKKRKRSKPAAVESIVSVATEMPKCDLPLEGRMETPLEVDGDREGFLNMCEALRPQILAKYAEVASFTEEDAKVILEQLWEGMEPEEKAGYLNKNFPVLLEKQCDASAVEEADDTAATMANTGVENNPSSISAAVRQPSLVEETTATDDAAKESTKIFAGPYLTRAQSMTQTRPSSIGLKSRVGAEFQADIPVLSWPPPAQAAEENYMLVSTPDIFASSLSLDYLRSAREAAGRGISVSLAKTNATGNYVVDGSLVVINGEFDLLAAEMLLDWQENAYVFREPRCIVLSHPAI